MNRWWADTLFKRLFVLMWLALVVSNLIAFYVVRHFHADERGNAQWLGRGHISLPVLPSLPPGGLMPDMRSNMPPGRPEHGGPPPADESHGAPQDHEPFGLPAEALWLDYGLRFVVIGIAAWFGARWLSAPMRRLAVASAGLGASLAERQPAPPLDAGHGTLEVRQAAQVFNTMAQRLHAQFAAQALLMAAISHDLRTPLARMRLRLEQMQGEASTQTAEGSAAQRCITDVREMDALIGSVIDMLRHEQTPEPRERIDLFALVQSLCDDRAEQGEAIALVGEPPGGTAWVVLARPGALNRVLDNLLGNALRHAGSAQVSVQMPLQVSGTAGGGQVEVHIEDRGPGIAPQLLEAVFQPFFRADPSRGSGGSAGSGLGLYIARDLTQREGGQLKLANRDGGGLRATLRLPLA